MNEDVERVHGYTVKEAVVFTNNRGFALAENPNAVQPFVTWQFTEENGARDYYWGHYTTNGKAARRDFEARITEYMKDYGAVQRTGQPEPQQYRYYAKYPLDIGTFPKTAGGPIQLEPFDERKIVEGRMAWGVLTYTEPLADGQLSSYELRAARDNPDRQVAARQQEKPSIASQLERSAELAGRGKADRPPAAHSRNDKDR